MNTARRLNSVILVCLVCACGSDATESVTTQPILPRPPNVFGTFSLSDVNDGAADTVSLVIPAHVDWRGWAIKRWIEDYEFCVGMVAAHSELTMQADSTYQLTLFSGHQCGQIFGTGRSDLSGHFSWIPGTDSLRMSTSSLVGADMYEVGNTALGVNIRVNGVYDTTCILNFTR